MIVHRRRTGIVTRTPAYAKITHAHRLNKQRDVPPLLPIGSHEAKLAGCTPEYAAPEVVSSCTAGADPGVLRPLMDTYSVGLVALQVLDVSGKPRTARFMASIKVRMGSVIGLHGALQWGCISYLCTRHT